MNSQTRKNRTTIMELPVLLEADRDPSDPIGLNFLALFLDVFFSIIRVKFSQNRLF